VSKRYPKPEANEWVQPVRSGYRMRCCDCALVHELDFRVVNGRVQFRVRRNQRATAACRRGKTKVIGARDEVRRIVKAAKR
jgi:hypothetical protein